VRIVVSGTHASGKSTLIADLARRHPHFSVLPDPFEMLDDFWDTPGAGMFAAQLRIAADRLHADDLPADVIAERGPLDFLAYLQAVQELTGEPISADVRERSVALTADALRTVDLLVVLPLSERDPIPVGADEDLALRGAMNDALLDLVDDGELVGAGTTVVEITGGRRERLSVLEELVRTLRTAPR